jgi:hypothetical protein
VERLLADHQMRQSIFHRSDADLAIALTGIAKMAHQDGSRYDGFWGWEGAVAAFVNENLPRDPVT